MGSGLEGRGRKGWLIVGRCFTGFPGGCGITNLGFIFFFFFFFFTSRILLD
jgi:hypothetical protein